MITKSGIIELKELYDFVENDVDGEALDANSRKGREFSKVVTNLTNSIPEIGGFYIWGSYLTNGLWRNIYIGKAGFNKTASLQNRIKKELNAERQFFWKIKLTNDQIINKCKDNYPKMAHKYEWHWERSFEKFNSTHIIWVSINDSDKNEFEKDILMIESDLIETMNPTANRSRPKPYGNLQENTIEIIKKIKELIHKNRPDKPFIPLEK